MNRASLFLLLTLGLVFAFEEEPECNASGSLWSNLVGNLDQMFWTPFLKSYSVVRYATEERPLLQPHLKGPIPRSCREMGISHLLDVVCIQAAAQLGWLKPCSSWARPSLLTSMATLVECPRQTWANNEAVVSLNHTLQRRQHCDYATRAMQCSFLHFHWVIPQLMATLLVIVLLGGSAFCCCCCFLARKENYE